MENNLIDALVQKNELLISNTVLTGNTAATRVLLWSEPGMYSHGYTESTPGVDSCDALLENDR